MIPVGSQASKPSLLLWPWILSGFTNCETMHTEPSVYRPSSKNRLRSSALRFKVEILDSEPGIGWDGWEGRRSREKRAEKNNTLESQPWEFKLGFYLPWLEKKTQIGWVENSPQRIRGLWVPCTLMSLSLWLCHTFCFHTNSWIKSWLNSCLVWRTHTKCKGWDRGWGDCGFCLAVLDNEKQGERACWGHKGGAFLPRNNDMMPSKWHRLTYEAA